MSSFSKEEQLVHAIIDSQVSRAASLLSDIEDINYQSAIHQNYSFLHFAAQTQLEEVIDMLLSRGIDMELVDKYGNTALWTAVANYVGEGSVIKQLLSHGANPDHLNKSGKTPKDFAYLIANYDTRKYFSELK